MKELSLSTRRQLELMQQLQELADERAQSETRIAEKLQKEMAQATEFYESSLQELTRQTAQKRRDLENQYAEEKTTASELSRKSKHEAEKVYRQSHDQAEAIYKQNALTIERKKKESEWQTLAVFDASKDGPQQMLDAASKRLHARQLQVDGLQRDANTLMAMRHLSQAAELVEAEPVVSENPDESAEEQQQANLHQLHQEVLRLQAQRLPSLLLEGYRFVGWWLLACFISAFVTGAVTEWSPWKWPISAIGLGTILTGLIYLILGLRAQKHSLQQYSKILSLLTQSRQLANAAQVEAENLSRQAAEEINMRKHRELAAAQQVRDQAVSENEKIRQQQVNLARSQKDQESDKIQSALSKALATADETYPPLLDKLAEGKQKSIQELQTQFENQKAAAQSSHDRAWNEMAEKWEGGFQDVTSELAAIQKECQRYFPDWSQTNWEDWQRPTSAPPAIQFGSCELPLKAVKNGISEDERLVPKQKSFVLPTLMTMEELPRMVITSSGAGRAKAVEVLQAMMLRFLTAMPAGKLRFTVIDPAALGENFSNFMHLADHDEQLIGGQIWTDSRQIDERLSLLADHMEKVLQKYLRNQFDSIHEYNAQAGEVAEPYHVLVIANFPAGLSDAAMRKIATISKTGPRCGVYTILSVDESCKLPNDFNLSDLLEEAVQLQWMDDRLSWTYPLYEKLPLKLDKLPPREKLNDLLQITGEESQVASKVEVPFTVVAPANEDLWKGSTARELVVPIGRAGANELQELRLGRGTAQHALISGKTGSGKSSLLHALITNLALCYSPDEVEFYLVDFKKGVEFKTYATGELPHARVIAIESEREFGVSVLERLDEELRKRGELFRTLGVQDLAGARTACDQSLPRVLLIIDEFQELFVTDDKLSQDAALLLDRLVRQGRAFGIHVLLGSQTLAGAYSLARSTIGQMAVRIALECSEADSHLILSDDNTAARLLSRPGEAIYNDQNGLVEGNSPFQVVWLPDLERQQYLLQVRDLMAVSEHKDSELEQAIVFEGNVPADPSNNELLNAAITDSPCDEITEPTIWLGSAVRIEPPTQITFRRQGGNNLVVLGQEEPLALGILGTALIAMASQLRKGDPRFTILDGTRPESTEQGAWQEVASSLPGTVKVALPRETSQIIEALNQEVTRRTQDTEQTYSPHFLIVHDLAQFRDLRITEEDYSFSSFSDSGKSKQVPLDKQFRNILREGPNVGVHVMIWCESYNSLSRFLDRIILRELDYRIALQMSSGDSTSFIDSPAAGRLGEHRALLYRDDLGTQVKFRPYGRPTQDWLAWVKSKLVSENYARS